MDRKVIFVGVVLFLFCFSIVGNACAQGSAGVANGDSFTYDFSAFFRSDNPNATIPEQLVEDNETQWVRFTITDVANLTISYSVQGHLVNGTETNSESQTDLETGYGGFPIIRTNLAANDTLYTSYYSSAPSPIVNETLTRTYQQAQRTINHATWTDAGDYLDVYFDQKTGMPVELHVTFAVSVDGNADTRCTK